MSLARIDRAGPGPGCDKVTPLTDEQKDKISKLAAEIVDFYKKTPGFTEVAWFQPPERGYGLADLMVTYAGSTAEDARIKPDPERDAKCSAHIAWAIQQLGWIDGRIYVWDTPAHDGKFTVASKVTKDQAKEFERVQKEIGVLLGQQDPQGPGRLQLPSGVSLFYIEYPPIEIYIIRSVDIDGHGEGDPIYFSFPLFVLR